MFFKFIMNRIAMLLYNVSLRFDVPGRSLDFTSPVKVQHLALHVEYVFCPHTASKVANKMMNYFIIIVLINDWWSREIGSCRHYVQYCLILHSIWITLRHTREERKCVLKDVPPPWDCVLMGKRCVTELGQSSDLMLVHILHANKRTRSWLKTHV